TGCSAPSCASPSIVVTSFPTAAETAVTHEGTVCPSSRTAQAPHCPSPQPYFAPIRPSSFRKHSSKLRSPSTQTARVCPLTVSCISRRIAPDLHCRCQSDSAEENAKARRGEDAKDRRDEERLS